MISGTLRVAFAAPLKGSHSELIRALEPRIELLHDPSLLPPMRWPAGYSGDPLWSAA